MSQLDNAQDLYLATDLLPSKWYGVKLREMSARLTAILIYGNEISIECDKKLYPELDVFLQQLNMDNDILDFMFSVEREMHIFGAVVGLVTRIDINDTPHYRWVINKPFSVNDKRYFAERFERVEMFGSVGAGRGRGEMYMNYVYTPDWIEITGYTDIDMQQPVRGKQAREFSRQLSIYGLNKRIRNKSGIVPAVIFKNYPQKSAFNNGFSEYSPEAFYMRGVQPMMNRGIQTLEWELLANTTKSFLNLTKEEFLRFNKNTANQKLKEYIKTGLVFTNKSQQQPGASQRQVEMLIANPQLNSYWDHLERCKEFYLDCIGLSSNSLQQATQRSATEIKAHAQKDFQVITFKRHLREKALKQLIIKTIMYHNAFVSDEAKLPIDPSVINISLNPALEMDVAEEVQIQATMMNAGLQTQLDAIKKIHKLDDDLARDKAKSIIKEQIAMQSLNLRDDGNNVGDNNDDNDKGGSDDNTEQHSDFTD